MSARRSSRDSTTSWRPTPELGAQVVRSADARRRLLNELDIEFQSLDGRVKSSLDRVWAVFGKVIGRDYLVEASRTLDEMARYLDDMDDLHGYGPATVRAIAVREKALAALLAENEQGISRVLGAEWLAETARQPRARRVAARAPGAHGRPAQGDERGLRREPRGARNHDPQGRTPSSRPPARSRRRGGSPRRS